MPRPLALALGAVVFLIVAIVVFAIVASYTFLPDLLGSQVAAEVKDELDLQKKPQVILTSDPPPEMLLGKFSGGRVVMRDADFGGLKTDRVTVELPAFGVDLTKSLAGGTPETRGAVPGEIRVEVSGSEIQRLARKRSGLQDVSLENGGLTVGQSVSFLGILFPVEVRGALDLRDGGVVYEPRRVRVAGASVPPRISRSVLQGVEFGFPIKDLPEGVDLQKLRIRNGKLILDGEARNVLETAS